MEARIAGLVGLSMLLWWTAVAAPQAAQSSALRERVRHATIVLPNCAGVIVEDRAHALTAAHCVRGAGSFEARLHDGRRVEGTVERIDESRDIAVLRFDRPVSVRPLLLGAGAPQVGSPIYFAGRRGSRTEPQTGHVIRVAECPSLPGVPGALFTDLQANKGDSGSPIVDRGTHVVGLVHGGAACNILTPTSGLACALGLKPPDGADGVACAGP